MERGNRGSEKEVHTKGARVTDKAARLLQIVGIAGQTVSEGQAGGQESVSDVEEAGE